MNKMVKGSVAGAAGVALLMGSFGTFALWQDEVGVEGSSITSGKLDITPGVTQWADESEKAARNWSTTNALVVPGDTITRTQTFVVEATGANMMGELAFDAGDVVEGDFGDDIEVTVDVQAPGLTEEAADARWSFDAPLGSPVTVTTKVTYKFEHSATAEATQSATATMEDSTFTLTQARP
jgi:alternate signal-mediated exported protein